MEANKVCKNKNVDSGFLSSIALFLTTCLKLRSSNQSKPKRQLRLYLCICIPTLAQSWAFSKDYGCKDNDYF